MNTPKDSTAERTPGSLHPAGSALKPWQYQCSKCGKIKSFDKRGKERGWCASCEVATWSPEKTKALARVIGAAMRGDKDKLPALTNEAMKHCAPNDPSSESAGLKR